MLISCSNCGRVHHRGECKAKRESTERTAAQRFRSTMAWRRLALSIRDRDNELCVACAHEDPPIFCNSHLSVHHIEPLSIAWDKRLDPDNCITLCPYHHERAEDGTISAETLRSFLTGGRS